MKAAKNLIRKVVTNDLVHNYISRAYFAKYPGAGEYWERRYERGNTSGAGSYGRLAEFKSDIIEEIIDSKAIDSVIEFGCGDGNQIRRMELPEYIGLDVSKKAIKLCENKFSNDSNKSFFLYDPECFIDNIGVLESDLGLSLDVIYHLTEDESFNRHMSHLFSSSRYYVIIYSSNSEELEDASEHVKHREFTNWVERETTDWSLEEKIENKYPYDPDKPETTSFCDFYIFKRE